MPKRTSIPVQLPLFDPITIQLTKGFQAMVDPVDADLAAYRWCASSGDYPYPQRRLANKRLIFLHRVILERMIGRPLAKGEMPDHIDGQPLNNCRSNLRLATKATNAQNSRKQSDNTSGYKGVALTRNGKWRAYIRHGDRQIHLGVYSTPEEAYAAYCKAAKHYYGEFARLE